MSFQVKKQQFISYCIKKDSKITKKNLPNIQLNKNKEAIFIEFRLLPHTSFIIKNAILKLGNEWSFTIVCGELNYDFYKNLINNLGIEVKIINTYKTSITREDYSIMLLKSTFWKQFHGEYLIIYQEDSLIFKKFNNKFLKYDYIGAPWVNRKVGNGGLSFRNKNIMIKICETFFDSKMNFMEENVRLLNIIKSKLRKKYLGEEFGSIYSRPENYYIYLIERSILEDYQITNRMKNHHLGRIADFNIANDFSMEKHYNKNAFGGHQFWFNINDVTDWLNRNFKI